jgi:hypothetical protein
MHFQIPVLIYADMQEKAAMRSDFLQNTLAALNADIREL